MGAVIMKIDDISLAFGYRVKTGGATPNWATVTNYEQIRKTIVEVKLENLGHEVQK